MKTRTQKDIWRELNDFYLIETSRRKTPEALVKNDSLLQKSLILRKSSLYKHVLSHQKLMVKFIMVQSELTKKKETLFRQAGLHWLTKQQVEKIPKPILIERFLKEKIHEQDFW